MQTFARVYHFYRTIPLRFLRFILLIILIGGVGFELYQGMLPKLSLFFLNIFLMIEVFVRYKLGRILPTRKLWDTTDQTAVDALTWPAFCAYSNTISTEDFMGELLTMKPVQFILVKAAISPKEMRILPLAKDAIVTYAHRLATELSGRQITTMDIIVSYLLLSEDQTKLLFSKELKTEQLLHILYWARMEYPHEEQPVWHTMEVSGDGLGELLVYGWTPETKNYTTDVTSRALRETPSYLGRQDTYKQVVEGLLKGENNNVLLVGDAGVGKESLLTRLIHDSFLGKLPSPLNHKRVFELMLGSLIAGVSDKGELTARVELIIAEISHAGNVILYIPDFEHVMGSASFDLNLAGAFLPYLKGGHMPIIATITNGNFKAYVQENPIYEVFTVVKLEPPDRDIAIKMLLQKVVSIESRYSVSISYKAVLVAMEYAHVYMQDRVLPGSAVTLLIDTANTVSLAKQGVLRVGKRKLVTAEHIKKVVEEKTHVAVGVPDKEESQKLLHLEELLHKRVIGQNEAISVISEALRRVRSGIKTGTRPISFLFLGPTGVGKTETAKALAQQYFGGEEKIIRLDMSEYTDDTGVKRLLGALPGEGQERGELTDKIHDHPFSLVLLDEFEKANTRILDLFLQVFEDGRLTDNKGRTVSFSNAIVIATSNAGSEFIREEVKSGSAKQTDFHRRLLEILQTQHVFKPELLNRFDAVVTFKPLGENEVRSVVKLMLSTLETKLLEQDITLVVPDEVVTEISQKGFDEQFGARPLRRYIQDTLEDEIAKKKLANEIRRGNTVTVTVDPTGALAYTVS